MSQVQCELARELLRRHKEKNPNPKPDDLVYQFKSGNTIIQYPYDYLERFANGDYL